MTTTTNNPIRQYLITLNRIGGPMGYCGFMWDVYVKDQDEFFYTLLFANMANCQVDQCNLLVNQIPHLDDKDFFGTHGDRLVIWELPKGYYEGKTVTKYSTLMPV